MSNVEKTPVSESMKSIKLLTDRLKSEQNDDFFTPNMQATAILSPANKYAVFVLFVNDPIHF